MDKKKSPSELFKTAAFAAKPKTGATGKPHDAKKGADR